MDRRVFQVIGCLAVAARHVYLSGNELPRVHTAFACFWGLMAGSYLTELYMITEMGVDL